MGITVCLTPEPDPGVCAAVNLDTFLLALVWDRSPEPETGVTVKIFKSGT